jgi:membrane fusion protein, multidrug efflux system
MSLDNLPPDSPPGSAELPPRRLTKIVGTCVAIAVVLALGLIIHARIAALHAVGGGFRPLNRGGLGPLAVGVAPVTTGDVPVTIDSLGTVTPLATVTVHPMVTGPLVKIAFSEGQVVKTGDLLAEIDPRPFQAAVDQATGQLAHDQALLANARVDLVRYKTLLAQNSVAEQTYATQQATVLQDEATVVSDKAALETAKLNLSYTRISSPVNGSVGLRQVDNGNIVTAYTSTIVVATQLQPMSVLFTVPEDDLIQVLERLRRGEKLGADAYDRTFTTKLDSGVLSNTDNEIDTTTGTLKLRALFNNSALELFPSQFVNVRLTLYTLHGQLLVPGSAVQNGTSGNFVYVVDRSNTADDPPSDPGGAGGHHGRKAPSAYGPAAGGPGGGAGPLRFVHVRYVTTGPAVGNFISIANGLQAGEIVVVDGAEQLRDGAAVTVPEQDQSAGAASPNESNLSPSAGPSAAAPMGSPSDRPAANSRMSRRPGGQFTGRGKHRAPQPGMPAAPASTPSP